MFRLRRHIPLLCLVALLLGAVAPAWAEGDAELQALGLLGGDEEQTTTTARIPRPISRIAENVTVITAEQIARLNVHTLAEVLQTVPGIQLSNIRTPGSITFFDLQGAPSAHVQVLVDGIRQNDLIENNPEIGLIPVQQIERIEIVKGAASAAWGQALGGVINVITKSPDPDRQAGGELFASAGERLTTDLRTELSGTVGRVGYYLSGGNLHSDGLLPNNGVDNNNGHGKVVYTLPEDGSLTLGVDYRSASRGVLEWPAYDIHDNADTRSLNSYLAFNYQLADNLTLDLTTFFTQKETDYFGRNWSDGALVYNPESREKTGGGNARLTWGDSDYNLVTGLEYEHAQVTTTETIIKADLLDRRFDRWSGYANGAVTLGRFTFLPGFRLDHNGIGSNYFSYTAGLTCRLTDGTVLRGYTANGYSLPYALLNQSHGLQKVWTAQAGVESSDVPYLWLKGTVFYNKISNVEVADFTTGEVLLHRQVRQGFELEARTIPLYGLSLRGGYTFTDAYDHDSGQRLSDVPRQSAKLAVDYDSRELGLKGTLSGNYVWWNASADYQGRYTALLWDLTLTKRLFPDDDLSPELFFSVHNIFNGSQYDQTYYKNPGRWLEGGVRWRF